ncbi:MAG: hypothetical protein AB7U73_20755 [Pirellulales bacterium]
MKLLLNKPPSPVLAFLLGGALLAATYALSFVPGDVRPEQLVRMIDRADRVVIFGDFLEEGDPEYESTDRGDLDELKLALRVQRPPEFYHCLCEGTTRVVLYRGDWRLGSVSNQHCQRLRCSLWLSDAPIADVQAFLGWFDRRGITWPRQEYDNNLLAEAERAREEQATKSGADVER